MVSKGKEPTSPAPRGDRRSPERRRARRVTVVSMGAVAAMVTVTATVGAMLSGDVAGAQCSSYRPRAEAGGETHRLSVGDARILEGDSGHWEAVFPVTLSTASTQAVSVDYTTAGPATSAGDVVASRGTITFAPGEVTKTISVAVSGDFEEETNEEFSVDLNNPANAAIADGQGQAVLVNDDGVTISIHDTGAVEGDQGTDATFAVTLSRKTNKMVTVAYTTADGTATSPDDYTATRGTLQFPAGVDRATISVPITDDVEDEVDERFFISLSGATNATLADGEGTATIYGGADVWARSGRDDRGDIWAPMATGKLDAREYPSVLWTDTRLIVWGGAGTGNWDEASPRSDGAAYRPTDDTWTCLPAAPIQGRRLHASAWTGEEMIIWGGDSGLNGFFADGAAYDPTTNRWRTLASSPLTARRLPSATWTGTEMIIWGGLVDHFDPASDGAAYNPRTDSWRLLPAAPLADRYAHAAVWTGAEMIIWGGNGGNGPAHGDGAVYNPTTDTWKRLADAPVSGRITGTGSGVWTGTEMLVWGGYDSSEENARALGDGAAYNPHTDTWRPMNPGPLDPGLASGSAWTGDRMLLWTSDTQGGRHGATYDPLTDTWRELASLATSANFAGVPVWTGREALMWGASGAHDDEKIPTAKAIRYVP